MTALALFCATVFIGAAFAALYAIAAAVIGLLVKQDRALPANEDPLGLVYDVD